jgi:hypothetical protein
MGPTALVIVAKAKTQRVDFLISFDICYRFQGSVIRPMSRLRDQQSEKSGSELAQNFCIDPYAPGNGGTLII